MTAATAIWQFAGSLIAVAVMIALTWRLGFSGQPVLADEREAHEWARGLTGGFEPVATVLDRSGHGALLRDAAGRIAAILPHGAHFVARLVLPPCTAKVEQDRLELQLTDRPFSIEIGERAARDWARAIDRLG